MEQNELDRIQAWLDESKEVYDLLCADMGPVQGGVNMLRFVGGIGLLVTMNSAEAIQEEGPMHEHVAAQVETLEFISALLTGEAVKHHGVDAGLLIGLGTLASNIGAAFEAGQHISESIEKGDIEAGDDPEEGELPVVDWSSDNEGGSDDS